MFGRDTLARFKRDGFTAEQFEDWIDYNTVEPWGEDRNELRNARLVWAVLQPHAKRQLKEKTFMFDFIKRKDSDALHRAKCEAAAIAAKVRERRESNRSAE